MSNKDQMRTEVLQRLKTIKGHIAGIEKMVEEDKDCETVLFQLGAVRGAMDKLSAHILDGYTQICLAETQEIDEKSRQRIETLTKTMISMIRK